MTEKPVERWQGHLAAYERAHDEYVAALRDADVRAIVWALVHKVEALESGLDDLLHDVHSAGTPAEMLAQLGDELQWLSDLDYVLEKLLAPLGERVAALRRRVSAGSGRA